jgi:hypothetical protein
MGVVWLGESGTISTAGSITANYNDIRSLRIQPVPEGPPGPVFVRHPSGRGERSLSLVRGLIPVPFPAPLDQGVNCSGGGDLFVTLTAGRVITYGPCRWPWQISELWGAMIEASVITTRHPAQAR